MKVEVIKVEDLEPFLEYNKLQGILTQKLTSILRVTELKEKWLKECVPLCTKLKHMKQKHGFKTDKEMIRQIKKHSAY